MIKKAIEKLEQGEVVGIPTETVYGLAADIKNEASIKKIFEIKERPFFDPLIIHVANTEQAKELTTNWNELAEFLAKTFWPGPMTMVLPKSSKVSSLITAGLNTVGLRAPNHPVTLELLKQFGPLAAPSANKFTKTSPTKASHVQDEFPDILVIDGGDSEVGIESTVLAPISNSEIQIYRPGMITKEILEDALKNYPHKVHVNKTTSPASPGQLKEHYRPKKPLFLVSSPKENGAELKLSETPQLAARELYSKLHELSQGEHQCIYIIQQEYFNAPEWAPIWDRLSKAIERRNR